MPVKPNKRALYGADWVSFSRSIRFDRAGGKCECDGRCGDSQCRGVTSGRCNAEHGKPHPVNGKRTILTCAHLTHDETSRDEHEVAAFCARCHIYYDRDHHAATRRETHAAKRAAELKRQREKTRELQFGIECATGKPFAR